MQRRVCHQMITQCARSLQNVQVFLDKAEADADLKNYDVSVLLNDRLAPDQYPFGRQIQIACDYVKLGVARLSGQTPPEHEDNELTTSALRVRIRQAVIFALTVDEDQYEETIEGGVSVDSKPGATTGGIDYFLQMVMPNIYFHVTIAYAILRQNAIDLGKMDFVGNENFIAA